MKEQETKAAGGVPNFAGEEEKDRTDAEDVAGSKNVELRKDAGSRDAGSRDADSKDAGLRDAGSKNAGSRNGRRYLRIRTARQEEDAGIPKPEPGYNKDRMRLLIILLGLLTAVLIAAVFYELILGYGLRETGAERMRAERIGEIQTEIAESDSTEEESIQTDELQSGEEPETA